MNNPPGEEPKVKGRFIITIRDDEGNIIEEHVGPWEEGKSEGINALDIPLLTPERENHE